MNIPFLNLKQQYEEHKDEIDSAVLRVLKSGWYILGKECEEFESNFKNYLADDEDLVTKSSRLPILQSQPLVQYVQLVQNRYSVMWMTIHG
jgi:hypothetical protein